MRALAPATGKDPVTGSIRIALDPETGRIRSWGFEDDGGHSQSVWGSDGKGIYSGLTRVVWELNPVEKGDGGTLFLSGTHKASFPQPPCVREPDNAHMDSYSCPAGSAIIFTE